MQTSLAQQNRQVKPVLTLKVMWSQSKQTNIAEWFWASWYLVNIKEQYYHAVADTLDMNTSGVLGGEKILGEKITKLSWLKDMVAY